MRQQHHYSGNDANSNSPRWRAALDALIGAPMRLHRNRNLHAEVIEDELRSFECGPGRENQD